MQMQKLNITGEPILDKRVGGKNAVTAIENYAHNNTQYLEENKGYAKLVGVQFGDNDKVYDYVDIKGTARTGDSPTVEVTNKWSGKNTIVPSKHTRIVSTGKSGILKNEQRTDNITNKGINLKVLDRKALVEGKNQQTNLKMTKPKEI